MAPQGAVLGDRVAGSQPGPQLVGNEPEERGPARGGERSVGGRFDQVVGPTVQDVADVATNRVADADHDHGHLVGQRQHRGQVSKEPGNDAHDIARAIRAPKQRRIPGRDAARMLREIGEQNARASC